MSVQGLHRFYRGRTDEVAASWMTREDRDVAILDNLAYVAAALDDVSRDESTRIVYAGFSQGVAMAFRAERARARSRVRGHRHRRRCAPGLLADRSAPPFPPVLLARGERDEWLTAGNVRDRRGGAHCQERLVSVGWSTTAPMNGMAPCRRRPASFWPRCSGHCASESEPFDSRDPCARSGQASLTAVREANRGPYASEASALPRGAK